MKGYNQFCPIARASEVLAERWTPIIMRNILLGCDTFNEIASGAPGLSRTLLTKRLRGLEQANIIEITPKPDGRGSLYRATPAGRELWNVLRSMGSWAERWKEAGPQHANPDMVLWSWVNGFVHTDALPDRRVNVRFEFTLHSKVIRLWLLVQEREVELCDFDPGFDEDAIVWIDDHLVFARWHLGLVEWGSLLRAGAIRVQGDTAITRSLATWNNGPMVHRRIRTDGARPQDPPKPAMDNPRAAAGRTAGDRLQGASSPIPAFDGEVLTPADPDWDSARRIWNGAIDRSPALIARCTGPDDVAAAVTFARSRDLPLTVRGGGHGVSGASLCDDGIVIDLSPMKEISVDPATRTARAGAGLTWGEFDAATQAFGLATTGGVVSTTGIAGLTLGGGLGHLMRVHGLTIDNLLSAEVVLANGDHVEASSSSHEDLFWALRGGGGSFGVVTSFTYRLHPVGPDMVAGAVMWDLDDAPEVLRFYRDFIERAPREVASGVILRKAPPAPFLPVEMHRRPVCAVQLLYLGDPAKAERALAPMRSFGEPLLDLVGPRSYLSLQTILDRVVPHGWHYYWKSLDMGPLTDEAIDTLAEHAGRLASPWSYTLMIHLGGAVADVRPGETAYSNRDATHNVNINGVWLPHHEVGESETAWTRAQYDALRPHETGVYVNFLDRDDTARVHDAYDEQTLRRLANIEATVDPDGVFGGVFSRRPQ